jgi:hypothetical protein
MEERKTTWTAMSRQHLPSAIYGPLHQYPQALGFAGELSRASSHSKVAATYTTA